MRFRFLRLGLVLSLVAVCANAGAEKPKTHKAANATVFEASTPDPPPAAALPANAFPMSAMCPLGPAAELWLVDELRAQPSFARVASSSDMNARTTGAEIAVRSLMVDRRALAMLSALGAPPGSPNFACVRSAAMTRLVNEPALVYSNVSSGLPPAGGTSQAAGTAQTGGRGAPRGQHVVLHMHLTLPCALDAAEPNASIALRAVGEGSETRLIFAPAASKVTPSGAIVKTYTASADLAPGTYALSPLEAAGASLVGVRDWQPDAFSPYAATRECQTRTRALAGRPLQPRDERRALVFQLDRNALAVGRDTRWIHFEARTQQVSLTASSPAPSAACDADPCQ